MSQMKMTLSINSYIFVGLTCLFNSVIDQSVSTHLFKLKLRACGDRLFKITCAND